MPKDSTCNLYHESFQRYLKSIKQTKLMIAILGPGKGNPGYKKRIEIRDHLRSANKYDDVNFPEDIDVPPEALPDEGIWSRLDFIIAHTQVVFALLVDDKSVNGVRVEVSRYGDKKGFREKAFLLLPKKDKKAKSRYLPLILAASAEYPDSKKLRYTEEEFLSCVRIRDYVAAKVNLYRTRLRYDEFMEEAGITTFEYS